MVAVGLNSGLTDAAVAVAALSDVVVTDGVVMMDGVVVSECSDADIGGFKDYLSSLIYLRSFFEGQDLGCFV